MSTVSLANQEPLKIALVIKECVCRRGGAERYTHTLAAELTQLGHQVHLLAHNWGSQPPPGVVPHHVPMHRGHRALKVLSFARYARSRLVAGDYDIVYGLTQIYPLDLYRMGGGIHLHWLRVKYPRAWRRWLARASLGEWAACYLERQIFQPHHHRLIIANSALTACHAREYYQVPAQRLRIIYNGVDPRLFHPGLRLRSGPQLRARLGLDERMLILFVSNNWRRKGLSTLIKASAPLCRQQQAALLVVGKGRPRHFQGLLRRYGLQGHVFFQPPTDAIADYYAAADVFVLPTWYDPFANTCLEAMACGLPVITSAANGAAELLQHGRNGFVLSDPQDEHTLARYLNLLLQPALRQQLGQRAAHVAREYTPRANALQTVEAFRAVLAQRQANNCNGEG